MRSGEWNSDNSLLDSDEDFRLEHIKIILHPKLREIFYGTLIFQQRTEYDLYWPPWTLLPSNMAAH